MPTRLTLSASSWTFGLRSVSLRLMAWAATRGWTCLARIWSARSRLVARSCVPIGSKGEVALSSSRSKADGVKSHDAMAALQGRSRVGLGRGKGEMESGRERAGEMAALLRGVGRCG
jgi:hypothetical protein